MTRLPSTCLSVALLACTGEVVHPVEFATVERDRCEEPDPINYFRVELFRAIAGFGCLSCIGNGSMCVREAPTCLCAAPAGVGATTLNPIFADAQVRLPVSNPGAEYCVRVLGTQLSAANDRPTGICPCAGDGSSDADDFDFDNSSVTYCALDDSRFSTSDGDGVSLRAYCMGDPNFEGCSAVQGTGGAP